jgi:pre-rRNA-processing protein TSR3
MILCLMSRCGGQLEKSLSVRVTIYHASQCDPKRCTGLKLARHGLARIVSRTRFLPKRAIVLNPFSEIALSPADCERISRDGIVALDCSWEHAEKVLSHHVRGTARCLPVLIAGNPTNYAKATKLSTAEALAGALYITGFRDDAQKILSLFKWGHTFFELNSELLENYSLAKNSSEIIELMGNIVRK